MVSAHNTDRAPAHPTATHVRYELITLGDELLLGLYAFCGGRFELRERLVAGCVDGVLEATR